MTEAEDWLRKLRSQGQRCFTDEALSRALCIALPQARRRLGRLRDKKIVFTPRAGFHVIVPPENSTSGFVAPELYVDELCQYLDRKYYVSLLTAAMYHGASHQKPLVYQVCVNRAVMGTMPGNYPLFFVQNGETASAPIIKRKTKSGFVNLASISTTCYDLVRFPRHAGGLSNVCTILFELLEEKEPKDVPWMEPYFSKNSLIQRLGYILDFLDLEKHAGLLYERLSHADDLVWTPLVKSLKTKGSPRSEKWKVIINETLEPDL